MIHLKRVYEEPTAEDGFRILVERLWPRGVSKQAARIDAWLKEVSPSPELRKWYAHDVTKWEEFKARYQAEIRVNPEILKLRDTIGEKGNVTFVYAAKDVEHNSARALMEAVSN
jgi:uncharacterized protein YeaO (DUF488 family)